MTPNRELPRADSRAAVSNARSIRKNHPEDTYDEMIKKSPFRIKPVGELIDNSVEAGQVEEEECSGT